MGYIGDMKVSRFLLSIFKHCSPSTSYKRRELGLNSLLSLGKVWMSPQLELEGDRGNGIKKD